MSAIFRIAPFNNVTFYIEIQCAIYSNYSKHYVLSSVRDES